MSLSVSSICAGLATLPQELYDLIYDEVFTASHEAVRNLNDNSAASLKLMQISHDSLSQYAASYYSTTFVYAGALDPLLEWASSLQKDHRELLQKVVYQVREGGALHLLSHSSPSIRNLYLEFYTRRLVERTDVETTKKFYLHATGLVLRLGQDEYLDRHPWR